MEDKELYNEAIRLAKALKEAMEKVCKIENGCKECYFIVSDSCVEYEAIAEMEEIE